MDIFKLQPTDVDRLEELVEEIIRTNARGLQILERNHTQNFNRIWNNPDFTPQEVLDKFGTSAVKLFVASKATQDFIKACNPDYEVLVPPKEFTINKDGTVTVAEEPEVTVVEE